MFLVTGFWEVSKSPLCSKNWENWGYWQQCTALWYGCGVKQGELFSILCSFNCQHNLQSLGRRVSARNDLDKVVPADTSVWNWFTYNLYRKTYIKWRQHHFKDRLYKSVGGEDSWDAVSKKAGPRGTLTWNSKSDRSLFSLCHLWSVYFITSTEMKVEQSLFNT